MGVTPGKLPDVDTGVLTTLITQDLANRKPSLLDSLTPQKREAKIRANLEIKSQWETIKNQVAARFPIVKDWIIKHQAENISFPDMNDLPYGNIPKVVREKNQAIVDIYQLREKLQNRESTPWTKLDSIKQSTAKAEQAISHFALISEAMSCLVATKDPQKLRGILAATMSFSLRTYNANIESNPNYSPITHAEKLVEYMQKQRDVDHANTLRNVIQMREEWENTASKSPNPNYSVTAKLLKDITSGNYVDATLALLEYPLAQNKV